ncbi:PREDICTED: E3 ubiquitin-protein ligase RNF8-like [Prunus mume]|uniref:RING-type E3 ubiquitin transferase n=1 Tax=Prunus mume TaxID=102107 RepID=A0ABM0PAK2_PRUMU|nr:PREDICTED: E3 ubiquitin-protein ligase RNF8-like [Prunus mume]
MEAAYHELHLAELRGTQLDHPDRHEQSSPSVPIEIEFKYSINHKVFDGDLSEDGTLTGLILIHQYEPQVTMTKATIEDVCGLETRNDVKRFISENLSLLGVDEDPQDQLVEMIIEFGCKFHDLDSNKGAKVLRFSAHIKKEHNWIRSERVPKERELEMEALIKKTLKRVRVVAADEDEHEDEDEEEEEEGGKRKRRVVQESEVCPICMEEFVVGSEDVASMPCSHVFHGNCIGRWLKGSHHSCPICRFKMPWITRQY